MQNIPTRLGNPGDLKFIGQTGATQDSTGFAKFVDAAGNPDPKAGYAALLNDIQSKINRNPNGTLVDFAEKYAPPSENNTGQYIANLANKLGVAPNASLKELEPRIGDMAHAIAGNEGFEANSGSLPGVGALGAEIQAQTPPPAPRQTPSAPPSNNLGSVGGKPLVGGILGGALQGNLDQSKFPFGTGTLGEAAGGIYAQNAPPSMGGVGGTDAEQYVDLPSAESVAGASLQAASVPLGLLAAPATIPGAILAGGALGAANSGGKAMEQNKSAGEVTKQAGIGAAIGGATAGAVAGFGRLLGAAGDKIMNSVIKPSKADIEDGFSLQAIKDNNLGGSLNQTLQKSQAMMKDLHSQLTEKLQGSTEGIDLAHVFDKTAADLKSPKGLLQGFGQTTKVDGALRQLQDEVLAVNPSGKLSIPDAQLVKQASGGMGAWRYGAPDPEAKATASAYNSFYHNLKVAIEENSPEGVKQINAKMGEIIPIINAVIRRIPVAERNGAISLNDMIGLVGSSMNPMALGPTIINAISKSGIAGNALSKLGPQIPKIAPAAGLLGSSLASPIGQQGNSTQGGVTNR